MRCDNRYCIYWCSTGCCFVMPETCPHRILQPDEQAADTSEAVFRSKPLFGHAERGRQRRRTAGQARHSAPRSGAEPNG